MDRPPEAGSRAVDLPTQAIARALNHPLLRTLVPTGMGISPQAVARNFESTEGRRELMLVYCAKGSGWCEMAGRRHVVRAGDLLVIPPHTPHACGADANDPWLIPWIDVTGENVQPLLEQLGATTAHPIINVGDDPKMLALFDDALTVAENERTYTTTALFQCSQTVGHLLSVILRRRRSQAERPLDPAARIAHCIEFMKQNLGEQIQLERLTALANLSTTQFSVLFRKAIDCAPMEYLIRLRMERARVLLEDSTLLIKEIASAVGYHDQANFCRSFRKMYGVSPTEYHAQHSPPAPTTHPT